jgi:hypothetical protein
MPSSAANSLEAGRTGDGGVDLGLGELLERQRTDHIGPVGEVFRLPIVLLAGHIVTSFVAARGFGAGCRADAEGGSGVVVTLAGVLVGGSQVGLLDASASMTYSTAQVVPSSIAVAHPSIRHP